MSMRHAHRFRLVATPRGKTQASLENDSVSSEQTAAVAVYTLSGCSHCARARAHLRRREIAFTEIRGDGRPGFRSEFLELTGGSTVPQIMVDGTAIGGASDLARLDRRGILLPLVRRQPFPLAIVARHFSPAGLAAKIVGVGCGPWRYGVEVVSSDGHVVARLSASEALAHQLADAFNAGDRTVSELSYEASSNGSDSP